MFDTNVTVDDESQLFKTPMKKNYGVTTTSTQNLLVSDTMKCQHNTATRVKVHKIYPYGKEYIYFQTDVKTSHASQCAKPCSLNKVIESIIVIESF